MVIARVIINQKMNDVFTRTRVDSRKMSTNEIPPETSFDVNVIAGEHILMEE